MAMLAKKIKSINDKEKNNGKMNKMKKRILII
jgi:hypothetical protein